MLLRIFIFSLLALTSCNAQKTGASAEKVVVDGDSNKDSKSEWENMELIPRDQLCLLCHSVIGKFQQASAKNPEQFKNDLLTSCALLKEPQEIKKCRDGVTDDQLAKLNTTSVDEICVAQKLCKEGETVDLEKLSEGAQPPAQQTDDEFEAIPDVEDAADIHSVDDPKGFKSFSRAQDTIQNAYAK